MHCAAWVNTDRVSNQKEDWRTSMNINERQCTPANVNAHQRTPMNTSERQRALTFVVFLGLVMSLAIGCHQAAPTSSRPLTQRGYLWQRAWNSAVADALTQAEN